MDLTVTGICLGVGNSASFHDIPVELVIAILSTLPVKTILLTTCVCKRWYSIIKTPSFISAQLFNSISNPINNYILLAPLSSPPHDDHHNFYFYSDNNLPSIQAKLKIPFQTLSKSVHIVGSCNGLVCITDCDLSYRGGDVYLINPFIHKYKKLSAEDSCFSDLLSMGEIGCNVVIGFGYSDVGNDYKVVRHLSDADGSGWSKVEVYSLKSGKWKVIDNSVYSLHLLIQPPLVDGCLYWWLPYSKDLPCFDLNCEVFRKIETPANYNDQLCTPCTSSFFQLNGSLALIGTVLGSCGTIACGFCIFMMEKDNCGQLQWKEFNYELGDDVHFGVYNYPLGFSSKGRLVFDHRDVSPKDNCYTEDESNVERVMDENEKMIWKIGVTDLDNLSAVEDITLDFKGYYTIDTNFTASLVFFLD